MSGVRPGRVNLPAALLSIGFVLVIALVCVLTYKSVAIVVSSILLVIVIISFSIFAYDMLIKVGNRNSLSIAFFVLMHVLCAIALFGNILRWTGLKYIVDPTEHKHSFWGALYFSFVTWTTVGYGDIVPGKNARAIATAEAILGYVAMAVLIAVLAAMFQSRQRH